MAEEEKSLLVKVLHNMGLGSPSKRAFDDLIAEKNFKKARESFPERYKKYIQDKRKKPKRKSKGGYTTKQRTGTTDYRKGGMTLSTVSNRKK